MTRTTTLTAAIAFLAFGGLFAAPAQAETGAVSAQRGMLHLDERGGIKALLGPGATVPQIGADGTELEYTQWAKSMLDVGRDAEAERSLEWAQVRNRVDEEEAALAAGLPSPPYDSQCARALCMALRAIGNGNRTLGYTQVRLATINVKARMAAQAEVVALGQERMPIVTE